MLWTMAVIMTVLWALGLFSGGAVGLWVHLLLLFGLVAALLAVASTPRARVRVRPERAR